MAAPLYIVDAFAAGPFTGNPAAVCLLESSADAGWMQSVAAEMNLSETAFLVPRQDGFDLRWFTPITEVDLCGHATLASAHVLWETERLPMNEPARFHTRSGMLTATRAGDWIEMDLKVLLIKRSISPHKNKWSLPGCFIKENESIEESAHRKFDEETGIAPAYINQF